MGDQISLLIEVRVIEKLIERILHLVFDEEYCEKLNAAWNALNK